MTRGCVSSGRRRCAEIRFNPSLTSCAKAHAARGDVAIRVEIDGSVIRRAGPTRQRASLLRDPWPQIWERKPEFSPLPRARGALIALPRLPRAGDPRGGVSARSG